jgi:hypothetical protein
MLCHPEGEWPIEKLQIDITALVDDKFARGLVHREGVRVFDVIMDKVSLYRLFSEEPQNATGK